MQMMIDMQYDQPVIDARDLGAFLDLEPAQVQIKMRQGHITSKALPSCSGFVMWLYVLHEDTIAIAAAEGLSPPS